MERATGKRYGPKGLAVMALGMTVLAGCDEGLNLKSGTIEDANSEGAAETEPVELFPELSANGQRDIEAPEVFQVAEAGLWDGRPSLGGIWVAHPDVNQPERVLIKNTSNNKTVTGALFRRDGNLPGPALQVSSSAAAQLDLLAGSPTRIEVVALRRETVAPPPPPIADEGADVAATDATPAEDAGTETAAASEQPAKRKWWQKKPEADTVAATAVVAGAAAGVAASASSDDETASVAESTEQSTEVAEVETTPTQEQPAKRKWWQKKPEAEAAAIAATAAAVEASDSAGAEETEIAPVQTAALSDPEVTTPAEQPAKRKWWQKKPAPEPEPDAALAAAGAAAVTTSTLTSEGTDTVQSAALTDAPLAEPTEKPAKRKWWQKKDPDAITETPLDPIAGAAAAIEAAEPTAATVAAVSEPSSAGLSKPYVQAGTFGVEANANSAAQKVRRNGMDAKVSELKTGDETVWRVLVGPVTTRADRRALLGDVKDLGFTDAFIAKN